MPITVRVRETSPRSQPSDGLQRSIRATRQFTGQGIWLDHMHRDIHEIDACQLMNVMRQFQPARQSRFTNAIMVHS